MAHESSPPGAGVPPVAPPGEAVCGAVRSACRRLYTVENDFVARFRASLTQLVPELRQATGDQGGAIAEGLARAVLWAGLTSDPPDVVEETFRSVGAEYGRRGFPPTGYHGAGHALLRAARDSQIAEWTSELSSAWVAYYSWLAAHLAEGARRVGPAAPPPTGPAPVSRPSAGPPPYAGGPPPNGPPPTGPPPTGPPPTGPPPIGPPLHGPPPVTADAGRPRPVLRLPMPDAGPRGRAGGDPTGPATAPASLDEVLELLYRRYFAGNERALGAIVTRVALRTGADLRAPRPDQRTNPAVIANVIAVLQVMGYVLPTGGSDPARLLQPAPAPAPARARWWHRRRSGPVRGGWGTSLPGTTR